MAPGPPCQPFDCAAAGDAIVARTATHAAALNHLGNAFVLAKRIVPPRTQPTISWIAQTSPEALALLTRERASAQSVSPLGVRNSRFAVRDSLLAVRDSRLALVG